MPRELFIGLMTGTSLDSADAVLVDFSGERITLAGTHREPLPRDLQQSLLGLTRPGNDEINTLMQCDRALGRLYAKAVCSLLDASGTSATEVHAIGSHGQTLRHQPCANGTHPLPWTLQIGDPATLAVESGIPVVADFRRQDIAAGGQGAPLVPAFHAAVFRSPGETRVILNIGGIANITVLPPAGAITGQDTGPGNSLMDLWIHRQRGLDYDQDGAWARSGRVQEERVRRWIEAEPWFRQAPPKSTGRETFGLAWLDRHQAELAALPAADAQACLADFTAQSIALAIHAQAPAGCAVFACGGGVHNGFLLERLGVHLPGHAIRGTSALGMDPEWVEAAAFAWLARQRVLGLPGNLPEVTGASRSLVLGGLYLA